MIGAIIAGAGALVSAGMAIKNNQNSRAASEAAAVYANQFKGMKETNLMAALQSPDIMKLLNQQTAQQAASATQAIQGGGPEAAAQIAALNKGVLDANAEAAIMQSKQNYQRDQAVLTNAQEVENRNIIAQRALVNSQLAGSQKAAANYANMASNNIEGAISGLGTAAAGLDPDILAYLNTKKADAGAAANAGTAAPDVPVLDANGNPMTSDGSNMTWDLGGETSLNNTTNEASSLANTPNLMKNIPKELMQLLRDNPELLTLLSNINK
jgi:hypothetical protein